VVGHHTLTPFFVFSGPPEEKASCVRVGWGRTTFFRRASAGGWPQNTGRFSCCLGLAKAGRCWLGQRSGLRFSKSFRLPWNHHGSYRSVFSWPATSFMASKAPITTRRLLRTDHQPGRIMGGHGVVTSFGDYVYQGFARLCRRSPLIAVGAPGKTDPSREKGPRFR